jgi:hypothetical protein
MKGGLDLACPVARRQLASTEADPMAREASLLTPDPEQGQPGPVHARLHSAATALSDADLLGRVAFLARAEREATVELVAHLAELDARQLYLGEGYPSLFAYCMGVLHLSEGEAANRIEAARAARRFPVILERLADGSVHLTAVRLLAPHLTDGNHESVLEAARHKTKRQVEVLVAGLCPRPDVPSTVRRLPSPPAAAPSPGRLCFAPAAAAESPSPSAPAVSPAPVLPAPPRPAAAVMPLAPERYKVQFTVDAATHAMLRHAQDLLRHQIPDGDVGAIFTRALGLLVAEVERKKLAKTEHPRKPAPPTPGSQHIPADVRRKVWARDGQRCAFIGRDGQRCPETGRLEIHHLWPDALGGSPTVDNLSVRCQRHNLYEAELVFGPRPPLLLRERGAHYQDAALHVPEHVGPSELEGATTPP